MELNQKILVAFERISEAIKSLRWEKAKVYGLSPIQIQILLFVDHHAIELCTISQLAAEFNVTKPTISDAVKVLFAKDLVSKDYSNPDSRSYALAISEKGKEIVDKTYNYSKPLQQLVGSLPNDNIEDLYETLADIIFKLNQKGILSVQRMCFTCKHHGLGNEGHFCHLLNIKLNTQDIQLDCPEYIAEPGANTR